MKSFAKMDTATDMEQYSYVTSTMKDIVKMYIYQVAKLLTAKPINFIDENILLTIKRFHYTLIIYFNYQNVCL